MAAPTVPAPAPEQAASGLRQLQRMRLYAKAVLGLGVAASLAANVLAANPELVSPVVSWVVAAWSPLALALTVELITRVPVSDGWLSWLRLAATATIAGIAAWVSYWHMVEVAVAHGEKTIAAHLLPLSVDGLVVVATVVLHELARKVHNIERPASRIDAPTSTGSSAAAVSRSRGQDATRRSPRSTGQAGSTSHAAAGATRRAASGAGAETRAAVEALTTSDPTLTQAEIAERLGVSVRTVRRHQAALNSTLTAPSPAIGSTNPDMAASIQPPATQPSGEEAA